MSEIKLTKRFPESRPEDITEAYMRGYEAGRAFRGTCRDISLDSETQFYCSECECTVDVPLLWGSLNYCPGCGKVVER